MHTASPNKVFSDKDVIWHLVESSGGLGSQADASLRDVNMTT